MTQRLEDNYPDWGAFERSPHESLRKMYFDAANFFEPSLRLAAEGSRACRGKVEVRPFQG